MIATVLPMTAVGTTAVVPMNPNASGSIPIGLLLDFGTGTGSGTASVEFTLDDPSSANAVWIPYTNLTAKTATAYDNPIIPVRAVRGHCTAYTSGTIYLRILQGNNYVES
jgi:hypothetical protein